MANVIEYVKTLSFLWERGKGPLLVLGICILTVNLLWLLVNLLYGEVLVYNLKEGKQYRYIGSFWIERKGGEFILVLPAGAIQKSHTTEYRLCLGRCFARLNQGKLLCIYFGEEYRTILPLKREMIAKNHVATSLKL